MSSARIKSLFVVLIVCCGIWACETDTVPEAETPPPFSGIVNGTETGYQTWQSVLSVVTPSTRCTGTLIHPQVVLTAGHCIYQGADTETAPQVRISGGATGETILSLVDKVVHHPGNWIAVPSFEAPDLAMLLLSEPLNDLTPHRLRDLPGPQIGEEGIIVGYGENPSDTESFGPVHRMGETAIVGAVPYYLEIGGDTNTCNGDSGGPLFTFQNDEWVLTGITSFGPDDCPAEAMGFDVNLAAFCGWLNDTLTKLVGEDLGLANCNGCEAQPPVEEWGNPCGPGYPCCPQGTECRLPPNFSQNNLGFCAPPCCNLGETEGTICTNQTPGAESCAFADEMGNAYCAIHCADDTECPDGTTCKNKPFESEKICIATETGKDPGCLDSDNTGDTDTTGDVDTAPDTATETDPPENAHTSSDDCTCRTAGAKNDAIWEFVKVFI